MYWARRLKSDEIVQLKEERNDLLAELERRLELIRLKAGMSRAKTYRCGVRLCSLRPCMPRRRTAGVGTSVEVSAELSVMNSRRGGRCR